MEAFKQLLKGIANGVASANESISIGLGAEVTATETVEVLVHPLLLVPVTV